MARLLDAFRRAQGSVQPRRPAAGIPGVIQNALSSFSQVNPALQQSEIASLLSQSGIRSLDDLRNTNIITSQSRGGFAPGTFQSLSGAQGPTNTVARTSPFASSPFFRPGPRTVAQALGARPAGSGNFFATLLNRERGVTANNRAVNFDEINRRRNQRFRTQRQAKTAQVANPLRKARRRFDSKEEGGGR